jgi:dienelactone hydrolase
MLHGCSGLASTTDPFPLYRDWRDILVEERYVVLMVDSATSRGFGQTCTSGEARQRMWAERPSDAYAALAYLQQQSFVRFDRIGLMG